MSSRTRPARAARSAAAVAAALAGALALVAALAGCGTPDPLETVADASSSPPETRTGADATATADPSAGSADDGASDADADAGGDDGGSEPVETNEVRLTWVETGGASSVSLVLGEDTPYQAIFEIATDATAAVLVESVGVEPGGDGVYSIASDGCTGVAVTAGAPCIVTVGFDPPAAGSYATTLVVTYAGGGRAELPVPIEVVDPDGADTGTGTGGDTGGDSGTGTGGETVQSTESAPPG